MWKEHWSHYILCIFEFSFHWLFKMCYDFCKVFVFATEHLCWMHNNFLFFYIWFATDWQFLVCPLKRPSWCVTGDISSDCFVDLRMTVFVFDLRLSPSPFCFVWTSCLTITSFSYDSDSCLTRFYLFADWLLTLPSVTTLIPAQPFLICLPQCLTRVWPFSPPRLWLFCPTTRRIVTLVNFVSSAGFHPSNRTLVVILLCYFSFIVFEGYSGGRSHLCWELATRPLWAHKAFED